MWKKLVFAACVAFVGVAGAQNPTDSLSVDVEDLGAIGGAGRRIRLISRNVNPQYGLGAILVRVDAMRSSAGQAPYVSYSRGFDVMWRSGYSSSIELNYRMLAYEWACLFVGASILYRRLS